jgi:vancomycin resistance protein VanJ
MVMGYAAGGATRNGNTPKQLLVDTMKRQWFVRAVRRMLIGAALVYSALLLVLVVLWALAPNATWWLAVTNLFAPHLWTPLPLLLIMGLAMRARALWLAIGLVGVLFVLVCGPQLLPPRPPRADGPQVRVLTLNQHRTNRRVEELVAALRVQNADLVALQEVSPEVAAALGQQLRELYPYQVLRPAADDSGLGLLSRFPLRALGTQGDQVGQWAQLLVGGSELTVANVHLPSPSFAARPLSFAPAVPLPTSYDTTARDETVAALLEAAGAQQGPLLVLGDFNLTEREPAYALLAAQLTDSYRAAGWGWGWTFPDTKRLFKIPYPYPLLRIDYVWARGVAPRSAHTACGQSRSDHCAVVAAFVVTPVD